MQRRCKDDTDLDPVFDLSSIVVNNEGRLHHRGELDVAVSLMLPLELIQQCLVGGLREAGIKVREEKNVI